MKFVASFASGWLKFGSGGNMETGSKELRSAARAYAHANDGRAWLELGFSLAIYIAALALALASIGNWFVIVPTTLLVSIMGVRIYMIQHDCLHRSFFTSPRVNDIVGSLISPITMTPYKATRFIHNQHHTYVSDLDRRDTFEINVMTLKEWEAAPPLTRLGYRLYRNPLFLIMIGPLLLYLIIRRAPSCGWKTGIGDLTLHNLLLAGYVGLIWYVAGWAGILIWFGALFVGCIIGALISYIFHNFETIHWGVKPELDFVTAALEGSSVLDWGPIADLAMLNICYHDLHHLNAKIPGYKLREAHRELEARGLLHSKKIGFIEGLMCLRWKLYDEDRERMIPFKSGVRRGSIEADESTV